MASVSANIALMLFTALLACACARDPNSAAQVRVLAQKNSGRELTVRFGTDPTPPHAGDNEAVIAVLENGERVRDATVAVRFYMPAMPSMNMPAMHADVHPTLQSDGTFHGTVNLVMAGTWKVAVTVSRDGQQQGTVEYTVIAK